MTEERAYTHLDHVRVVLGNAWIEREWSTLIGNTVSLFQKQGEVEWLAADSVESRLVVNGEPLGLLDLGAPEWSEQQTPYGALLSARYSGPRFGLELWTMALHRQPALLRGGALRNGTQESVVVDRLSLEEIPVVQAICEEDTLAPADFPWEDASGAVAIRRPGKCLVVAYQSPLSARAYESPTARYSFETTTPCTLLPGQRMVLPGLLLLAGRGEPINLLGAAYPAAVRLVRDYHHWQQERLREH